MVNSYIIRECQVLEAPDKAQSLLGATVTFPQEDYRTIPLTKGQVAIVDVADYEWLSRFSWHAVWSEDTQSFYAGRGARNSNRKHTMISMHREIMGVPLGDSRRVDHRDHDTLNNRRSNLRVCTIGENNRNARKRSDNTSGFKGVYKISGCERWAGQITSHGVQRYLGSFKTPELANKAVREAREALHGEFANHGDVLEAL